VEIIMELIQFTLANFDTLMSRTVEHIALVSIAVGIATLTGVPIGIAITKSKRAAQIVLYVAAIIVTIPSIALFGIMMPILSIFGYGIGYVPAVIAVLLYSQLPIIRNTYTAINNVDPALREAARGIGMSPNQRLRLVEIPLAIPVIMAGVRTAVVLNIGVMAIAAYIGAGGLGTFISRGISQSDPRQLIVGAVAVSLLAVVVDYALLALQKRLTPKGMAKIIHAG
jgi:osmoprotectant transport system permease protein